MALKRKGIHFWSLVFTSWHRQLVRKSNVLFEFLQLETIYFCCKKLRQCHGHKGPGLSGCAVFFVAPAVSEGIDVAWRSSKTGSASWSCVCQCCFEVPSFEATIITCAALRSPALTTDRKQSGRTNSLAVPSSICRKQLETGRTLRAPPLSERHVGRRRVAAPDWYLPPVLECEL